MRTGAVEARKSGLRWTLAIKDDVGIGKALHLPSDLLPFWDAHVDLWSKDARKKLDQQFAQSPLLGSLEDHLKNLSDPFVLKIPPSGPDHVPWEALQVYLDPRDRPNLVSLRMTDTNPVWAQAEFGEKMKILVVVGHPGHDGAFNPQAVSDHITAVVSELDASAKARIEGAGVHVVIASDEGGLAKAAALSGKLRPNIVIFYGHGKQDKGPLILCGPSPRGWTRLAAFADQLFPDPAHKPRYWIFWACSLAEDSGQPDLRFEGPEIFRELKDRGATSVLAMRSRIRVDYSKVMLRALLQALAAGRPLEMAAAFARTAACARGNTGGRIDFAAPAVWSLNAPVERIYWDDLDPDASAAWDALPLFGVEDEFAELAAGVSDTDPRARQIADAWSGHRRVFVAAPTADLRNGGEAAASFFSVAAAIRNQWGRPVIPILLRQAPTFHEKLQNWAATAHRRLDPRGGKDALAAALGAVKARGVAGLGQLLAIKNVVVMFSEPPDIEATWQMFDEAPPGTTIVMVGKSTPEKAAAWTPDRPGGAGMELADLDGLVDRACSAAPIGSAMMALFRQPVSIDEVASAAGEARANLENLEALTVRVSSRNVLGETARTRVLGKLESSVREDARGRCVALLARQRLDRQLAPLLEIARLLAEAKEWERAADLVNAAFDTWGGQWLTGDWLRLIDVAEDQHFLDELSDGVLLGMASALLSVQQTAFAELILQARSFEDLIDRARKSAILSETNKAQASLPAKKALMRKHAGDAVKYMNEGLANDPDDVGARMDLRRYQLNQARIEQYFDGGQDTGFQYYSDLIAEIGDAAQDDPDLAQLAAAAYRNAAESRFDNRPSPLDPKLREQADTCLVAGLDLTRRHKLAALEAELLYTQARLLEALDDGQGAKAALEQSIEASVRADYPMLAVIGRDRLHWLRVETGDLVFALHGLMPNLNALDLFEGHAWAARVAIKSRIRAARKLVGHGGGVERQRAMELLQNSRRVIRARKFHVGVSDLRRAALTYAGLALFNADGDKLWDEFRALKGSAAWPAEIEGVDVDAIWKGGS